MKASFVYYEGGYVPRSEYLKICLTKMQQNKNLGLSKETSKTSETSLQSKKLETPQEKRNGRIRIEADLTELKGLDTKKILKKTEKKNVRKKEQTQSIRKNKMQDNEIITAETNKTSAIKSLPTGSEENPGEGLRSVSKILKKEISTSMSLIDKSALHLFEVMKSTMRPLKNQEEEEVSTSRLERVKVVVTCAREIKELIKVKVDAARVFKSLT